MPPHEASEFQRKRIGEIPSDWSFKSLGSIAVRIQDGTHFSPNVEGGPFRYVTSKNIRFGFMDLESCEWISESQHSSIFSRCPVQYGDVLLTKDGANTGNAALNNLHEQFSMLSSVALIRLDGKHFTNEYLLHYLLSAKCQQRLKDLMSGNAITRLTLEKINTFEVPFPNNPIEQRRIAEILDTADEAIRKTEALIAKLKQMKAGLLHDLLTRGIDENGELRASFCSSPSLYRGSEIGPVPVGWKVGPIQALAHNHDGRRIPLKKADRDQRRGKYRYYGASGVIDMIDDFIFDGDFVLLGEDGENLNSRSLPLAFVARGRFWVNNHAHVLEPLPETDLRFLAEILEFQNYSGVIIGSAQPKLSQASLNKIRFRIPPANEQKEIALRLQVTDERVSAEEVCLSKLREVKRGLMRDLLAGRVRVNRLFDFTSGGDRSSAVSLKTI